MRQRDHRGFVNRAGIRLVCLAGLGLVVVGCAPGLPVGPPELIGEALAQIGLDGVLSCEESCQRNQYNLCPDVRPEIGTDENGITWEVDRFFFGLLPNPYHTPYDCYRGSSEELGLSSYQCCYDGEELVDQGERAGSFDFFDPFLSFWQRILHFFYDIRVPCSCS